MNTDVENEVDEQDEAEVKTLNLSVKVDETSACERHVTVSIPREDIERYFSEKFDELAPQAEVPGFRAGKAPRKLIENRFRDQVEDQVKGSLLMDSLAQINDEQDFSAISEPDFDFESIDIPDEGAMTYEFNIEVRPEFDLPDWKGLKLNRTEHDFSDVEVDEEIKRLGGRFSNMVPTDDPAEPGDYLMINLLAKHDGKEISRTTEQLVPLRPTLSFPDAKLEGFDKLMKGKSAGDKVTAKVQVSEFSNVDQLQGEDVELEITLLEVKRQEEIELSALAEKLGFEDGDKLRELIRENLTSQLQYSQRQEVRKQISELLTESASWELPQDLLRRQSRRELDRARIELRSSGFSEDQIIAQENQLRQNVMQRTETMLKEHFILERIAEAENIEEEEGDFELEIAKIAVQRNDSPRRVRARLERTGQMDALRNMIVEQKVLQQIEDNAEIKAVAREKNEADETAALEFFVSGTNGDSIPEAKFDDGGGTKPTGAVVEHD